MHTLYNSIVSVRVVSFPTYRDNEKFVNMKHQFYRTKSLLFLESYAATFTAIPMLACLLIYLIDWWYTTHNSCSLLDVFSSVFYFWANYNLCSLLLKIIISGVPPNITKIKILMNRYIFDILLSDKHKRKINIANFELANTTNLYGIICWKRIKNKRF